MFGLFSKKKKQNKWIYTDDMQWCLPMGAGMYELIEFRIYSQSGTFAIANGIIDLTDYSKGEIEQIISSFGYHGINHVKEIYGSEWEQIIAECVFESIPDPHVDAIRYYDNRCLEP